MVISQFPQAFGQRKKLGDDVAPGERANGRAGAGKKRVMVIYSAVATAEVTNSAALSFIR